MMPKVVAQLRRPDREAEELDQEIQQDTAEKEIRSSIRLRRAAVGLV